MKKFLSLVLVLALVLALGVPAFAAETGGEGGGTTTPSAVTDGSKGTVDKITGSTVVPTINVTIPTGGTIILNPYKLDDKDKTNNNTEQVISATQYIVNGSDVPITVSASVLGKPSATNVKLGTKSFAEDTRTLTNSVFLQFEAIANGDSNEPSDWKDATQVVVGTSAKKSVLPTIDEKGGTKAVLAYRITGDAVANPTIAWTTADKVDVEITFTFVAEAAAAATVSGS